MIPFGSPPKYASSTATKFLIELSQTTLRGPWLLRVAMQCKIHYSLLACLADLIMQCPAQDLEKPSQVWKAIK